MRSVRLHNLTESNYGSERRSIPDSSLSVLESRLMYKESKSSKATYQRFLFYSLCVVTACIVIFEVSSYANDDNAIVKDRFKAYIENLKARTFC